MIHRKALVHSFISCLLITAQSQTVSKTRVLFYKIFPKIGAKTSVSLLFSSTWWKSLKVTREEIIASRDLRYRQLEGVLDRAMKQIENHRSGVKPLPQKKVDQLESKIQIYEHQIEELGRALDEEVCTDFTDVQRLQQRQKLKKTKINIHLNLFSSRNYLIQEIERMIKIREDYLKSREHGELWYK